LTAALISANQTYLTGVQVFTNAMLFPLTPLPGSIMGLDWKGSSFTNSLTGFTVPANATGPADPLWTSALSISPAPPAGRTGVVELNDVSAPFPYLVDQVDESFNSLRNATAHETGWDLLSSLENAYTPLTEPLHASEENDWLFTGRAFTINPVPITAGWMVISREDFGGQVYWRVFLKARYQDGSQGKPLMVQPWDLNARFEGQPRAFEQGGRVISPPEGYWIDFTEIALRYGWERLPALMNWRAYYQGTRFNEFVMNEKLDWDSAMRQLYPPEALTTATSQPTFTPTATSTSEALPPWKTATYTPEPTQTEAPRPTWTPMNTLPVQETLIIPQTPTPPAPAQTNSSSGPESGSPTIVITPTP
jgi:TolB protein